MMHFLSRPHIRNSSIFFQMTVQSPQVTCTPPVQPTTITVTETTPTTASPPAPSASAKSTTLSIAAKAAGGLKVSFRDRIKALQHDSSSGPTTTSTATSTTALISAKDTSASAISTNAPSDKHDLREKLIAPFAGSSSSKASSSKPPSTTLSIKEKLRQFSHGHLHGQGISTLKYSEDALKPWSKLKMATVVSTGGSYSSLSSSQNEESPTDTKPIDVAKPDDSLQLELVPVNAPKLQVPSSSEPDPSRTPKLKTIKLRPMNLQRSEPKHYKSVDDLSPEYSGLPFVKKLKILNERQKLAALESVIQTRSFSLDCADSETADADLSDSLIRSYSEASGMARTKKHSIASSHDIPARHHQPPPPPPPLHDTQCLRHSPLMLSPESDETIERRQLKSILKRLSDEKSQDNTADLNGQLQLMQAQTIEGYVARHSKFAKSVTFNSTLSSPPHSARSDQQAALSCVAADSTSHYTTRPSQFPAFNAQSPTTTTVVRTTSQSPTTFLPPTNPNPIGQDDNVNSHNNSFSVTTNRTAAPTTDDLTINDDDARLVSATNLTDDSNPIVAKKFMKGRIVGQVHYIY